jgi:hypothetical protein
LGLVNLGQFDHINRLTKSCTYCTSIKLTCFLLYVLDYLIVLNVVQWPDGLGGVLGHDVEVHEGAAAEKAEATRTAKDAAQDVLGGLLQPMADSVLELLVPHHETGTYSLIILFFSLLNESILR